MVLNNKYIVKDEYGYIGQYNVIYIYIYIKWGVNR